MVFQGAMHSLNPVVRVADQVGERMRADGRPSTRGRRTGRRAAGPRRPAGRDRPTLPARAVGGHEAARHDRHGAHPRPAAAHPRRAHERARREHPGPDHEPAQGAQGRATHGHALRHARPGAGQRPLRPHRRGLRGPGARARNGRGGPAAGRSTPTRRACWRASPACTRRARPASCPARHPTSAMRCRAVASRRAARSSSRPVRVEAPRLRAADGAPGGAGTDAPDAHVARCLLLDPAHAVAAARVTAARGSLAPSIPTTEGAASHSAATDRRPHRQAAPQGADERTAAALGRAAPERRRGSASPSSCARRSSRAGPSPPSATSAWTSRAGETVALVGESGSGKTTLGRATLRLVAAQRGPAALRGSRPGEPRGSRAAGLPAARAGHLPGSLRQPQPVHARG